MYPKIPPMLRSAMAHNRPILAESDPTRIRTNKGKIDARVKKTPTSLTFAPRQVKNTARSGYVTCDPRLAHHRNQRDAEISGKNRFGRLWCLLYRWLLVVYPQRFNNCSIAAFTRSGSTKWMARMPNWVAAAIFSLKSSTKIASEGDTLSWLKLIW